MWDLGPDTGSSVGPEGSKSGTRDLPRPVLLDPGRSRPWKSLMQRSLPGVRARRCLYSQGQGTVAEGAAGSREVLGSPARGQGLKESHSIPCDLRQWAFTLPHNPLRVTRLSDCSMFRSWSRLSEAAALPSRIGPAQAPPQPAPPGLPPHQGPRPQNSVRPFKDSTPTKAPPPRRPKGQARCPCSDAGRPPAGQSTGRGSGLRCHSRPGGGRHGHGGNGGSWSRCRSSDSPAGWLPDCGPGRSRAGPALPLAAQHLGPPRT